jgi:outer membrane protein
MVLPKPRATGGAQAVAYAGAALRHAATRPARRALTDIKASALLHRNTARGIEPMPASGANMKHHALSSLLMSVVLASPGFAGAADSPWTVRIGAHNVDPAGGTSHTTVGDITVDNRVGASFNIEYRLSPQIRLDVLAALPFKHDIRLDGNRVGSTRHLPPTVSLQWHPAPDARFDPFVGIGVNYTLFFEEALDIPARLELKDSWGLAGRMGIDYHVSPQWLVGVDLRYINIESEARLDGARIGDVKINPIAYGLQLGYRF